MSVDRVIRIYLNAECQHVHIGRLLVRCASAAGYEFIAPNISLPIRVRLHGPEPAPKNSVAIWMDYPQFAQIDFEQNGYYQLEGGDRCFCPNTCASNGELDWKWRVGELLKRSKTTDSIQFDFDITWVPHPNTSQLTSADRFWPDLMSNAREYYFIRCLWRGLPGNRLICWNENYRYHVHGEYFFRRNSRRSKIIPAFEDYCRQVGFACVDDLDSPVVRVPDFVPAGPVFPAVGSVDD